MTAPTMDGDLDNFAEIRSDPVGSMTQIESVIFFWDMFDEQASITRDDDPFITFDGFISPSLMAWRRKMQIFVY